MNDDAHVSGIAEWHYIGIDADPPLGKKVNLLTKGHVQVIGNYTNDGSFIAWAPLIKRNKAKEAQQKELDINQVEDYLADLIIANPKSVVAIKM